MKTLLTLLILGTCALAQVDSPEVLKHLKNIISTENYRNYENVSALNIVATYIRTHFESYADTTFYQEYKVGENTYKNVVCRFGDPTKQTIVIGAHYDVFGEQDGADDNASGVAGLLELARLLHKENGAYQIELVAFTLEEPPFFRTKNMGSYIHAKSHKENGTRIYGMISLEMIGYFSSNEGSQSYPDVLSNSGYSSKGDFIALVALPNHQLFVREFIGQFREKSELNVELFVAPRSIEGVDFSDHLNYWNFNYDALMITDTAFLRNKNYHEESDELSTLDIAKMSQVIESVYKTIKHIN